MNIVEEKFSTCDFAGVYSEYYQGLPQLDQLFNVITSIDSNPIHKFFVADMENLVKMGEESGTCGKRELDCVEGTSYSVQADTPIWVNFRIEDCLGGELTGKAMQKYAEATASTMLKNRIKFGLQKNKEVFEKKDYSGDVLADLTDDITQLSEKYSSQNLVIVVNPKVRRELAMQDIECCDYMIQNREIGEVYVNKFGISGIYVVPSDILTGADGEEVAYQIYVKDNSLSLESCLTQVQIEQLAPSADYISGFTRVKGEAIIGHEVLLNLAESGITRINKSTSTKTKSKTA